MKGGSALLVAATLALLLAGCASPSPATPPAALGPNELEAGAFYAFRHSGGDLVFAMAGAGSAEVVLFGDDDVRIGRIGLGDAQASGRFVLDGVARGEPVVQVLSVNGTLDLRSGGSRVTSFERLPAHVERHVLLQQPLGPMSILGIPALDRSPADETVDVRLLRAPASLRLLTQGVFEDLDVRLVGRSGTVLRAEDTGGAVQPMAGPFGFRELVSQGYGENVRDGALEARVTASHFEGVLLLQAEGFSRARPDVDAGKSTHDVPRFTYGVLPDQPVSFHVRPGTEFLYLFQEGPAAEAAHRQAQEACREADVAAGTPGATRADDACAGPQAVVALFGPDDGRVATLRVPANRTMAVAVTAPGEWVAVLLEGQATLGADRVPADFELHPLDIRSVTAPSSAASQSNGEYAQATDDVRASGVLFRLRAERELDGPVFGIPSFLGPAPCGPSALTAMQGGETIGAWGYGAPSANGDDAARQASRLLGDGEVVLVHDDFGPDCERWVLHVDGYVR